jgi:hypothetical protein
VQRAAAVQVPSDQEGVLAEDWLAGDSGGESDGRDSWSEDGGGGDEADDGGKEELLKSLYFSLTGRCATKV